MTTIVVGRLHGQSHPLAVAGLFVQQVCVLGISSCNRFPSLNTQRHSILLHPHVSSSISIGPSQWVDPQTYRGVSTTTTTTTMCRRRRRVDHQQQHPPPRPRTVGASTRVPHSHTPRENSSVQNCPVSANTTCTVQESSNNKNSRNSSPTTCECDPTGDVHNRKRYATVFRYASSSSFWEAAVAGCCVGCAGRRVAVLSTV